VEYRGTETQALQMLIDHEMTIKELYQAYARKFPDHHDYWMLLASEEKAHAEAISKLLESAASTPVGLKLAGFKPVAVTTSLSYMKDLIKKAESSPLPIGDALSSARDLEKAMIERKFFEIFDTPAPLAQQALILLTSGTQKHIDTIEHEWRKYRQP
jgi:hypothetical protein